MRVVLCLLSLYKFASVLLYLWTPVPSVPDQPSDPEFAAAQPVYELLRSNGVQVFVPNNLDGIHHADPSRDLPPLELDWLDGLPSRMSPAARPVNPRLYEHGGIGIWRFGTFRSSAGNKFM